jgi:gluconate 2-dehydrogenase gamma chain
MGVSRGPMSRLPRRHFLQGAIAASGLVFLHTNCGKKSSAWRSFTDDEARALEALCEQIVPGDQDPGAREAGVLNFLDRQLRGPLKRFLEDYHFGLAALERTSQQQFGKAFTGLLWDQQTQLLKLLEADSVPRDLWSHQPASRFFATVVDHTMMGFYGSPRHGGNRRFVSYRMLKLATPPILGQNRYKR